MKSGICMNEREPARIHPVLMCVRFVVGILKLPVFFFFLSVTMFYYCIALIMPVRVRTVLIRILSKVFMKLFLVLFGHWYVSKEVSCLKNTALGAGTEKVVSPGDVIIANFGSYINIFWLQKEYAPLFAIPTQDGLISHSFYSLFFHILAGHGNDTGNLISFAKAVDTARTNGIPLVIFPEDSLSDGKSVLPFRDFLGASEANSITFHIMGLIHRGNGVSANYTSGNSIAHLIWMLGRTFASMKVCVAAPSIIPVLDDMTKPEWINHCRRCLAGLLRVPLADKPHVD